MEMLVDQPLKKMEKLAIFMILVQEMEVIKEVLK